MRSRLSYLPLVLGFAVAVLTLPLVVMKASQPQPLRTFSTEARTNEIAVSLFPAKADISVGAQATLGVILESNDKPVRGVDLVVDFDPSLVKVTNVTKGLLFDNYLLTQVDSSKGEVFISAVNKISRPITGIIASIGFKTLRPGTASFTFKQFSGVDRSVGTVYTIK